MKHGKRGIFNYLQIRDTQNNGCFYLKIQEDSAVLGKLPEYRLPFYPSKVLIPEALNQK